MPSWTEYKEIARSKGVLAKELFVVFSNPIVPLDDMMETLPQHLAYQGELEARGVLVMAGPMADESGQNMVGESLIIYRANSIEEARAVADKDPMHIAGKKAYTVRPWLLNEGRLELSIGLSDQSVGFG